MEIFVYLVKNFVLFVKNVVGIFNNPYITYRRLAKEKEVPGHILYIFIAIGLYFGFASLLRTGFRNPYLLSVKFTSLTTAALTGILLPVFVIFFLGKLLGGKSKLKNMFVLWSYTLVPTLFWFFLTSILYLLLPPPRTLSVFGKLFSLVFIAFSLSVLLWKMVLFYLALRFGLKLDLLKIIIISLIITPLVVIYSFTFYKLGILRIPFI